MIKVGISKQSNYPVRVAPIKRKLADFLTKNGIISDAEVSVAIVGEKKMMDVGKYLKDVHGKPDKKLHNVLSFTPSEVKNFIYPPDNVLHLGEIVVCYPLAVKESEAQNILIDERVYELVEHGALHLLGIHHEE